MAESYEDPPAFVPHRLLGIERSQGDPSIFRLCHHYFLTRLKLALKQTYRHQPTEYLRRGLHRETVPDTFFFGLFSPTLQTNFLIIHGSCTVLALNVPCPYFVQELLLGATFQPGHPDQGASVARLLLGAEVSERDEAFIRKIAGPEAEEWWYKDDTEEYPPYHTILQTIGPRVREVCIPFSA